MLKILTITLIIFSFISISIADEDNSDSETIGEVVVTADKEKSETIIDKPGSSSVVIPLSGKRDQFVELKDILTSQAGIHIREFSGSGHMATVNMRGVSAKGVLVMIDGVPLNGLWATGVDLSNIPLSGFEEIEILKGGGSAFYGDFASGGAINLKTTSSVERKNHVSFTFGSFNLFKNDAILNFHNANDDVMLVLEGLSARGDYSFLISTGKSLVELDDYRYKREIKKMNSI